MLMHEVDFGSTTVFYPGGQQKIINQSNASLSTADHLIEYNKQLENNLNKGIRFTRIFERLIETNDTEELLKAVLELSQYKLDSTYLIYPKQYSSSDFYLIFLSRLLQLHNKLGMILQENVHDKELHHEFVGINQDGYFIFKLDTQNPDGAYYFEKNTRETLFYINFTRQVISFNSEALTNLLVVNYGNKYDFSVIKKLSIFLLQIGRFFKEDFGYDVDFNYLDPSNQAIYEIVNDKMPQFSLDKLFIKASQAGYMLVTNTHNEAQLDLNDGTRLLLFNNGSNSKQIDEQVQWVMQVQDPNNQFSWLDLLFRYEFLHDWYLENIESIGIKSSDIFYKGA